MPKNGQTTTQLHSSHMLAMFKILQARFQQCMNRELPDAQAGFRKGRDQIANISWIIEKAREIQKNIYFCFIDYAKAFDSGSQQTVENSERDGNTRPPVLLPEKSVCRSRSKLEPDMEQWTGSKLGKEYLKAVHCHPAYLSYMQSTSREMPG